MAMGNASKNAKGPFAKPLVVLLRTSLEMNAGTLFENRCFSSTDLAEPSRRQLVLGGCGGRATGSSARDAGAENESKRPLVIEAKPGASAKSVALRERGSMRVDQLRDGGVGMV
ncbi:hypothetical protein B0H12DRAFT_1075601 [Mycena haematopus]|nr:hypothetical protein B0H12DRAFT_1075601 [Mycena haematopus]